MRPSLIRLAVLGALWPLTAVAPARAQSLDGLVLLKDRSPVPYAMVEVCPVGGNRCVYAKSGRDGRFWVPRLDRGAYKIVVTSRGTKAEGSVQIGSDRITFVKINMVR